MKAFADAKKLRTFAARKRNSGAFCEKLKQKTLKIKFANSTKVNTFAARKRGNNLAESTLKKQTKNLKIKFGKLTKVATFAARNAERKSGC